MHEDSSVLPPSLPSLSTAKAKAEPFTWLSAEIPSSARMLKFVLIKLCFANLMRRWTLTQHIFNTASTQFVCEKRDIALAVKSNMRDQPYKSDDTECVKEINNKLDHSKAAFGWTHSQHVNGAYDILFVLSFTVEYAMVQFQWISWALHELRHVKCIINWTDQSVSTYWIFHQADIISLS